MKPAAAPLVTLAMPVRNATFFHAALSSAVSQDFSDLEILVFDDSEDDAVEAIVGELKDDRVYYERNIPRRGFSGNFSYCFSKARGDLVKFLNDDDLLHPACVSRMVAAFEEYGSRLVLVTSKRRIIDENGARKPDSMETQALCPVDALLRGIDLGNLMLQHSLNFVGEPTTVMFRRSALESSPRDIFELDGYRYHCLADMSLWLRLLARGQAAWLADELSAFRVHRGQEQRKPEVALRCVTERRQILPAARGLGFLSRPGQYAAALRAALEIHRRSVAQPGLSSGLREALRAGEGWLEQELRFL